MKVLLTMSMTFFVIVGTLRGESDYERYRRALRNNPVGIVDLTVIDDRGVCVKDVEGKAMYRTSRGEGWNDDQSYTDKNGHVLLKGRTNHDVNYSLEKEGYYTTTGWYDFTNSGTYDSVKKTFWGYEWVPPYKETVVLKKIRNPISMYACHLKEYGFKIPAFNQEFPFDLQKMDWCSPHGKGVRDDVYITLPQILLDFDAYKEPLKLTLKFKHPDEGMYVANSDMSSAFRSDYSVNLTASFKRELKLGVKKKGSNRFGNYDQHYVFRIRCKHDENDQIKSAHYGKIYGSWLATVDRKFGDILIYFNPTPNDTNLEYDMKRNLYKGTTYEEGQREEVLRP